jgi:hypothetical protein
VKVSYGSKAGTITSPICGLPESWLKCSTVELLMVAQLFDTVTLPETDCPSIIVADAG